MAFPTTTVETFTADEARALAPYFTNTDRPVFVLRNLPETVKGALFARYSRSAKSVRRLFLDEFLGEMTADAAAPGAAVDATVGSERADKLYARVLSEYGDDSVAQLGGAHIACEGVSNVLTKVLEWGRLMAYLEQSTRYVPYTSRPDGHWKYHVPPELDGSPLREEFVSTLDRAFETYARWIPAMEAHFRAKYPKSPDDSEGVYKSVIRAKALDTLRGLLPAATTSNVGPVRHRSGVRSAAASHVRPPARGGPRLRAADADRAAPRDSGLSRRASISRTAAGGGSSISPTPGAPSTRPPRRSSRASTPSRATK